MTLVVAAVFLCGTFSFAQTPATAAPSGFRVSGIIVDYIFGNPLGGTTVTLAPVTARQEIQTFKTGEDGRFSFRVSAKGKYSLAATRRGYHYQAFDQHEGYSTAIAAGPGLNSEELRFRLRPDSSIHGVVIDEQGEPATNVSVRLYKQELQEGETSVQSIQQSSTDDRGEYYFSHLLEGTYYVAVSGKPWYSLYAGYSPERSGDTEAAQRRAEEARRMDLVYPLTFYSGSYSSDDATPIHLKGGDSSRADLTVAAVPALRIRFTVPADPEPTKIADGKVGARTGIANPPNLQLMRAVFGTWEPADNAGMFILNEGEFGMGGIAPGHYILEMSSAGRNEPLTFQELDVTGDLELTPSQGNSLAKVGGTVSLNGLTVQDPALFIALQGTTGQRNYGTQVNKGKFEFEEPVLPGLYEVVLSNQGGVIYMAGLTAIGGKVSGRSMLTIGDKNVRLSISTGEGLGEVNGVANLDGRPHGGAMVLLVPAEFDGDANLVRRDQSDSDGTFTLLRAAPGKYKVIAIENGWDLGWADPKVLLPYLKNAPVYEVRPNEKLQVTVDVQRVAAQ